LGLAQALLNMMMPRSGRRPERVLFPLCRAVSGNGGVLVDVGIADAAPYLTPSAFFC
jgi:hypothetical protein